MLRIIENNGFICKTLKSDIIVRDIILSVLSRIGKSYLNAILNQMCSLYGFSENELLSDYQLFEVTLRKILGKSAFPILLRVKKELLKYAVSNNIPIKIHDILDPSLSIPALITMITEPDIYKFIDDNLDKNNHIVFLYTNEMLRDKVINYFFTRTVENNETNTKKIVTYHGDDTNIKNSFSSNESVELINLEDLFDELINEDIVDNINQFGSQKKLIHSSDNDSIYFVHSSSIINQNENYHKTIMFEEFLENLYKSNKAQILCLYSMLDYEKTALDEDFWKEILRIHNIVITDVPISLYEKFTSNIAHTK